MKRCACHGDRKDPTCRDLRCQCPCHSHSLWLQGGWVFVGFDTTSPSPLHRAAVDALVKKYGRDPVPEPVTLEAFA